MHAVVSKPALSNEQAWADLSGYLNSLPRATFPQTGDGRGLELGEAIFQDQCASCHQEDYLSRMRGPIKDHDKMNNDGTVNN